MNFVDTYEDSALLIYSSESRAADVFSYGGGGGVTLYKKGTFMTKFSPANGIYSLINIMNEFINASL